MAQRSSRRARSDTAAGDDDLADWIDRARRGDTEAYGWIWQRLSPRVHGYERGRGAQHPEDVTSEVFLAALTGIGRFEGTPGDFRAWLFTIAHHKAVDELRRRTDDAALDADSDPRRSPSAESAALDAIVDTDVRAMLAALTDEQREVLLLRTLGDLSVEQVAATTGRSVGTVKQLFHRAVATSRRTAQTRAQTATPPPLSVVPTSYSSPTRPSSAVTQAASTPMTEM
jgi:RNA polymerase sigma-70 factor (ECF subfamily)